MEASCVLQGIKPKSTESWALNKLCFKMGLLENKHFYATSSKNSVCVYACVTFFKWGFYQQFTLVLSYIFLYIRKINVNLIFFRIVWFGKLVSSSFQSHRMDQWCRSLFMTLTHKSPSYLCSHLTISHISYLQQLQPFVNVFVQSLVCWFALERRKKLNLDCFMSTQDKIIQ